MGRLVGMCCRVLLCIGVRTSAAEEGEARIDGLKTSVVVLTSPTRANHLDGKVIEAVIVDLQMASPTFRELLAVLAASPRLLTLMSPSSDLRYVEGMIGKTRFSVGPNRVVAFVDIFVDRTTTRLRDLAIAHELGHVAEVACLGPFDDQKGLNRIIRQRADWSGVSIKNATVETAFATAIGLQVVKESRSHVRLTTSQFMRLAAENGLTACPRLPLNDGLLLVQQELSDEEGGGFRDDF